MNKRSSVSWEYVLGWLGLGLIAFVVGPYITFVYHGFGEAVGIGVGWALFFMSVRRVLVPAVKRTLSRVRLERLWKEG